MYKPKHFSAYELVDRETYELLGDISLRLLDDGLLMDLDSLRESLSKKITVNDWYWGGRFSQRGFRTLKSNTGGKGSQHRRCRAIDFVVDGMSAKKVRNYIKENKDLYPSINRLEGDVTWVHIDSHPDYKSKRVYVFKP